MSLEAIASVSRPSASNPARDLAAAAAELHAPAATGRNSADEVRKAAGQFEAIILRQLLSPSIEPMMNGGLGGSGGTGGGIYGYMLTDVLADALSKGGGLGLSKILNQQLSPRPARLSGGDESLSTSPDLKSVVP